MFNILIDTSVWLDLALDAKQSPLLDPLSSMATDGYIKLLVPRLVIEEFTKNRQRVADRAQRSLKTHFGLVKDAIRKVKGDSRQAERVLKYLADIDHRIPLEGGLAVGTLDRIEQLLRGATAIESTDAVKLRAAERALARHAPCHHENKNGVADAVLIEVYFDCVRNGSAGERFAFVTHNRSDFSDINAHQKLVHPDLAAGFSRIKSLYFVSLADCLPRIDPVLVGDAMWESAHEPVVRSLSDILEAMDRLTTQVWYNRHKNLAWQIERGKHTVVTRAKWEAKWQKKKGYGQTHTIDSVWEGALKAARRAQKKLGTAECGPWSDFEWGMINGKLSALRWALGEEWDMLDT